MRKKRRKRKNKRTVTKRRVKKSVKIIGLILLILIILGIAAGVIYKVKVNNDKKNKALETERNNKKIAAAVKNNYADIITASKDIALYDKDGKEIGKVLKDSELFLDGTEGRKYKVKDTEYYISYLDLEKQEEAQKHGHTEYTTYKNYIPYNINVVTKESFSLYIDETKVIDIKKVMEFPVIIKTDSQYGIEFNNKLYYLNKTDIETEKENTNTDLPAGDHLPVLNYHYTVNREAGETNECLQSICTTDTQVDEEIKYLSDNGYYALTMRDVYLYLTGAIQIPKHSVVITIDDGWYVSRMITILNNYKMVGTLFLIGSLAAPEAYASDYLEIHSHSWNMHTPGVCNTGTHGGAILCWSEDQILEDLKKSRESLNNTTVYCFPFYEYNTRALNLLKQAGFNMAFVGGERSARVGDDLFKIPRYVIVNYTSMNEFIRYVS